MFEFLTALFGTTDAPVTDEGRAAALAALTNDQLTAMRDAAIADIHAAADGVVTPAIRDQMRQALTVRNEIEALLSTRATEVETLATDVDSILAEVGACAACDDDGAATDTTTGDGAAAPADGAATAPMTATAGFVASVPARPSAAAMATASAGAGAAEAAAGARPNALQQLRIATDAVPGFEVGGEFDTVIELSDALLQRWQGIRGGRPGEKFAVATVDARIPADRQLIESDVAGNVAKMGGYTFLEDMQTQPDLAAAICAPREPLYDLACQSSTARPVANSLASFGAPRFGVSVYPSPKLADVDIDDQGIGIWTRADDADDEALKACTVIPCDTPENYDVYGIWRCLTIKNMNAMSFPELVAAFLNRLSALQSRLAETTLLNAMAASVNTIDVHADTVDYGASIAALESVLRLVTFYKEAERYGDIQLHGWAHRHVRDMLIADVLLQRRTDNTSMSARIGAARDVDAAFSDLGVNMTWTLDRATSAPNPWPVMTPLTDGGALPEWPTSMSIMLSPEGNFKRLDQGNMNIGVTPGNIYRDNESNSKNQFTMFWESFEGLVDFGCTNVNFKMTDVCVGGHQVADVVSNCDAAQS